MKEVIPGVTRGGLLQQHEQPRLSTAMGANAQSGSVISIEAELLDVRSKEDIPRAFEKAAHSRIDGLIVGIDVRAGRVRSVWA